MNNRPQRGELSGVQRALLNELADEHYSLPEIVEFLRAISQERNDLVVITHAQDLVGDFLAQGWVNAYTYFPPYDPDESEQLSQEEALRILDDPDAWRGPVQHAHPRIGLTPAGEKVWHASFTSPPNEQT